MTLFSYSYLRRQIGRHAPTSRLARFTLYLLVVDLFLYVLRKLEQLVAPNFAARSSLGGWVVLLSVVLVCLGTVLALRWFRHRVMWRLRNRLIVTYVFIGVIPVLLIVAMVFVAGYLFAGQFATFLVTSDLQSELRSLEAANSTVSAELATALRRGTSARNLPAIQGLRPDDPRLKDIKITAWYRGEPIDLLSPSANQAPIAIPRWAGSEFHGVVSDNGSLYLRTLRSIEDRGNKLTVISGVPVDNGMLEHLAQDTGEITIYLPSGLKIETGGANSKQLTIQIGENKSAEGSAAKQPPSGRKPPVGSVRGGKLPPPARAFDREVTFATPFSVVEWSTGEESNTALQVNTRPSLLYARLFSRVSQFGHIVEGVLVVIGVFFAMIELLAFLIGVGLTRTITRSVAELYRATQHINRGDLRHRIAVKSRDQLADLENSFNSMSQSLEALIAEQKEKERMQNELTIAQEVQAQLFPKGSSDVENLEVYGVCRPARTVSGDYYDFLPLGPDRLAIAVGDISGKGISAALLMATVHSAVRAYEFGRVPMTTAHLVAAGAQGPTHAFEISSGSLESDFSPAAVLSLLNRQLYRSTPAEKYATLFLGVYDGGSRILTYSNAGHLPPVVIAADGSVRRLDTPGLVIGLFDDQGYEERTVSLHPGDILLAFSDGVTEPENEFGEFGEERLIDIVRQGRHFPLARISEQVTTAVGDWIGPGEQPDDVTLVLARAR